MLYRMFKLAGQQEQIIDIRADDTVTALQVSVMNLKSTTTAGQSDAAYLEFSFLSSSNFQVNDTTGVFATVQVWNAQTSSNGEIINGILNLYIDLPSLKVQSGERIYMRQNPGALLVAYCQIYTASADQTRAVRRR